MPVAYSQKDLSGLLGSKGERTRVLDAVERLLVARHQGAGGHATFTDLPLDNPDNVFKVFGVTGPGAATLRVFPGETNEGPSADTAFYLVLDSATGALEAVLAGDDLNALRTAVPAGLGARHLAPRGARVAGVLGSGEQARACSASIVSALPGLGEILVWSPTKANRERFAREQSERLEVPVRVCEGPEEVVRGADVLLAAGRLAGGEAAYDADWVKPGALAISLTHSAPAALSQRSTYVVPTENRPKVVAFGFVNPRWTSSPTEHEGTVALADIIAGDAAARATPEQTVVFELANIYPWDHAIAAWAYEWARENAQGTTFRLS